MSDPAEADATELNASEDGSSESPCIGICELDELGMCRGCLRSIDEIASWSGLDAQQKGVVLARIERRRANRGRD